jgi:hypothetical protein
MRGRSHRVGEHRCLRKARPRGGCLLGVGAAAGAFLGLGLTPATAPRAHADIEDLILQPIVDAIGHAISSVEPSLSGALNSSLDAGNLLGPALAAASATDPTVPLQINDVTEPVVDISVNGGSAVPVLVDSGSDGLVIPAQDIGFQTLSFPTGLGVGAYSGGLDYFYLTYDMPVNFGDGIVTPSTPVDVALFEWPTNIQSFLGNSAVGIMGVGPDSGAPGPSIVTEALPGVEGQGLLIDEPAQLLGFGANPDTGGITLQGAPITTVDVSVNGGPVDH